MNNEPRENVSRRIEWVDLYRGILIFLVCLGHRSSTRKEVVLWLYSFHIPAFFFISGYLVKDKKYENGIQSYFKDIAIKMVIPYFSLSLLYIFVNAIYCIAFARGFLPFDWLMALLTTNQIHESVNIGPIWFLHSLIFVEIISLFLNIISNKPLLGGSLLAVIGLMLIIYKELFEFMIIGESFLLNIPTVLIGSFFYECGHFLKRKENVFMNYFIYSWQKNLVFGCSIVVSLIVSIRINDRVDLRYARLGNPFWFIMGVLSGISFIFFIVKFLMQFRIIKRFFIFYGQNTLTIMTYHMFPGFMILETLSFKLLGIIYGQNVLTGKGEGTLYSLSVLILLTPLILLFNRYTPIIVGKTKQSNKAGST